MADMSAPDDPQPPTSPAPQLEGRGARPRVPLSPRTRVVVAVVALAAVAAIVVLAATGVLGRSEAPSSPAATTAPTPSAAATGTTEPGTTDPATTEPPPPALTATVAGSTVVATDLPVPWGVAALPDGTFLVTLRDAARLEIVDAEGGRTRVTGPGADEIAAQTASNGESGLLGLALSPSFAADGLVYVYRTGATDNAVLRAELDGATLGATQVVIDGIPSASFHDGGALAFGPDGHLYIGTGDATDPSTALDVDSLGGKILRVTADGEVPDDNPVPGSPVWTSGHRNVQGLGWDAQGRMYASEFGQDTFDELNQIVAGRSYGWPDVEGAGGADQGYTDPLVTWSTDDASPSGLAVTEEGVYVAALRGERLWRVDLVALERGEAEPEVVLDGEGRLRAVVVLSGGDLLVATSDTDGRGDPADDDDRLLRLRLNVAPLP